MEKIDILNPFIAEMLKTMENIFWEFEVDFFLVGALARDIQLSSDQNFAAKRRTNDVDIAILINSEEKFYAIKDALINTGNFEQAVKEIKLIYKGALELDLLPFGEIENEERELQLSKHTLMVMDMRGFKEVHPFVETLKIAEGLYLDVCTLEGLVMLKLIANDDNPGRTKDISDIEHVLEIYFDINNNEIYTEYMDVMDLYDTSIPKLSSVDISKSSWQKNQNNVREFYRYNKRNKNHLSQMASSYLASHA
jgi:predicted nucleotidyltransferase